MNARTDQLHREYTDFVDDAYIPLADRYQPRYRTGADEPRTGANRRKT